MTNDRSLLLFLVPHKVGFFRISLTIPNEICSNKAQSTRKIKLFFSGDVSAFLPSGLPFSRTFVFAVNLGYRDNVHEF